MKNRLFPCLIAVFISAHFAYGSAVGGFGGVMDTESLGRGDYCGGFMDVGLAPFVSLRLSGGYANGFDKIEQIQDDIGKRLGINVEIDDIGVVPLEAGLIADISFFGFVGIYAGGGYSYYVMPDITMSAVRDGFVRDFHVKGMNGWWVSAGAELGLPNILLFAEIRYSGIATETIGFDFTVDGRRFSPRGEMDMSNVSAVAGIKLKW